MTADMYPLCDGEHHGSNRIVRHLVDDLSEDARHVVVAVLLDRSTIGHTDV